MEGGMALSFFGVVVMSLLFDFTAGLVIQSTWSHARFKNLPPASMEARLRGDLLLECSVSGSPAPEVAWYKDSLFVSHKDWSIQEQKSSIGVTVAKLRISCLTQQHAGIYECRAKAGDKEISAITKVKVVPNDVPNTACILSPRPEIAVWKETLLVEEGDTATLPCRVQDSPLDYRISWTNTAGQDPTLENTNKFSVQQNGDLVIRDVTFSEMGQFTCTVSGTGGSQSIHTFLYPLSKHRNSNNLKND